MTISNITADAYVEASLLSYDTSITKFYSGFPNMPLGKLKFTAKSGDMEIQKIVIEYTGSAPQDVLSNLRIMNPYGEIISGPGTPKGTDYVFSNPFGIHEDDTDEYFLIGDVSDGASLGESIAFSINESTDITSMQLLGQVPSGAVGNFPLKTGSLRVIISEAQRYVTLTADLIPNGHAPFNSENFLIGTVRLTAIGGNATLKKIRFKAIGSLLKQIYEVRILDEEGNVLEEEKNIENGIVILEERIDLDENEEVVLTLVADVAANHIPGETFGYEITSENYLEFSFEIGDGELVTNFPQIVSHIRVHGETNLSCEPEDEPTCGRTYADCDDLPCEGVDTTYQNSCKLREAKAFLLFEGDCDDMPKPTSTTTTDTSTDTSTDSTKITNIPFAGFDDDVLKSVEKYANPFPDTNMDDLEGVSALELFRRDVLGGYPDGEFKGWKDVNRAEAAKFLMLTRYGELEDGYENTSHFLDVPTHEWFAKYVLTAAQKGIINGHPDGNFKPGDTVNTAEFLKMLTLTFGLSVNLEHPYKDVQTTDWFSMYAGTAFEYDLFPGRVRLLKPSASLSRNEVAVALYQYLKNRD